MSPLRDHLHRAVDADAAPLDLAEVQRRVGARRRRRRGVAAIGAASLLIGAGALAAMADEPTTQVTAAQGDDAGDGGTLPPPEETTTTVDESVPSSSTTVPPTLSVPATTTSVPPSSSVVEPLPTTPLPGAALELRLPYEGIERYTLDATGCDDPSATMSHRLEATIAVAGTSAAGSFVEDYCSRTDGSAWSGAGTFTIDLPEGTLTGSFTSAATLPTDGEPYQLQVEGGTGDFTAATGTCDVSIAITQKRLGSQVHSGTVSCAIDAPAAGAGGAGERAPQGGAPPIEMR